MSLTGFSLGMNNFHLEAFPLSALKSRFQFQETNLHIFGLVGKVLARKWFLSLFFTMDWDCGSRRIQEKVQKFTILVMMGLCRSEILLMIRLKS
jgi:hypothetical protein